MRVLLVECVDDLCKHTLAVQILELPCVRLLYIAGKDEGARKFGLHIYGDYTSVQNTDKLVHLACQEEIQIVVIEPENPVAGDILNACEAYGMIAFVGLCNAMPLLNPPKDLSS